MFSDSDLCERLARKRQLSSTETNYESIAQEKTPAQGK